MTLDTLVERLQSLLGENLRSVVLYGSAAGQDHHGKGSDVNVLLVLNDLGLPVLRQLAKVVPAWRRAGNPAPLIFTRERLERSADVFPLEILDMQAQHRILVGDDYLSGMNPSKELLRLQIEQELRGKLIHLRSGFLETRDRPRAVCDLMTHSLSGFLVLARASLRLFEEEPPTQKRAALQQLNTHIPLDLDVFDRIQSLKDRVVRHRQVNADGLFERYLSSLEALVDGVDSLDKRPTFSPSN